MLLDVLGNLALQSILHHPDLQGSSNNIHLQKLPRMKVMPCVEKNILAFDYAQIHASIVPESSVQIHKVVIRFASLKNKSFSLTVFSVSSPAAPPWEIESPEVGDPCEIEDYCTKLTKKAKALKFERKYAMKIIHPLKTNE